MTTIANLLVEIKARNKDLKKKLMESGVAVDKFSNKSKKKLKSTTRGFKDLGRSVSGVKSKILGLVAAVGLFRAATSTFSKGRGFSAAIADLSAITGATGKDLLFLSNAAKEFGRTTTLSASQAAEAFKLVASAKPDLLKSVTALRQVTKEAIALAEATGSTLPEAAKTLGSALNQFGKGADQASRFVNVLAAGSQKGASEVADISEALKDAGIVAAQTGLSFEETNAALQALAKDAIKGGRAGTALKNVLLRLSTQADNSINPAIQGIARALDNLHSKNLTTAQSLRLFGRLNISAGQSLIKNRKEVRRLTRELTGTNTAYEQAAIKANSFDGRMKALSSTVEGLQLELFAKLKPALTSVVEATIKFVQWLTTNINVVTKFAKVIGVGGALVVGLLTAKLAITAVTISLGVLKTAVAAVTLSTSVLGKTMGAVFAALAGWQIGKQLREQFDIVRVSALRFVKSTMIAFETLKFAMKVVVTTMVDIWDSGIGAMTQDFKNFTGLVATGLSKVPGFQKEAEGVKLYADSIRGAGQATQSLGDKLAALNAKRIKEIAAIKENTKDLISFELAAKKVAAVTKSAAGKESDTAKKSFGTLTDVSTGRTFKTNNSGNVVEIKVTADKEGIINAVVQNEQFKNQVVIQSDMATQNAARMVRR